MAAHVEQALAILHPRAQVPDALTERQRLTTITCMETCDNSNRARVAVELLTAAHPLSSVLISTTVCVSAI